MKYKITKEQSKKIISKIEEQLNSYFSSDDRICGFRAFLNEDRIDEEDSIFDVYTLLNKEWVLNDDWSSLRSGYIRDSVKEYLNSMIPFPFEVYSHASECKK
jgi:hypothetical protein